MMPYCIEEEEEAFNGHMQSCQAHYSETCFILLIHPWGPADRHRI